MPIFGPRDKARARRAITPMPILGIMRQDGPQPHGRCDADLAISRHGPHRPHRRFHAYIRGFVFTALGPGLPGLGSFREFRDSDESGWLRFRAAIAHRATGSTARSEVVGSSEKSGRTNKATIIRVEWMVVAAPLGS
jgi:hypothetical protein